jgi:protein TonB
MFDLIAQGHRGTPHTSGTPLLISTLLHGVGLTALIVAPLLVATSRVPEAPSIIAFVAPPPAVVAPPPPPPPPAATQASAVKARVPASAQVVPVEAPAEIAAETPQPAGSDTGVAGGVEGGVPGGVPGGVVGGLAGEVLPPPPPPPPAPVVRGPVRVGGELQAPALLKRVGPEYPELAMRAQVEGVVILEAIVDRQGRVEDVHVLRSIPLLDNAAKAAVRQWQYSPLLLNGQAERFIVTVTVSFTLKRAT